MCTKPIYKTEKQVCIRIAFLLHKYIYLPNKPACTVIKCLFYMAISEKVNLPFSAHWND